MADTDTAVANPTVVIAKRGDVLLKVGTEPNETTALLVSSTVLSLASKVFDAMFNGGFAEGQNLSLNTPYELPLPDDNAKYMTIICKIMHMQTADVPEKLSMDDLTGLAVLCDKYACADGIRAWSRMWLSWYSIKDSDDAVLLTVAYLLDLLQEFRNISRNLIQHHILTTRIHLDIGEQDFLPLAVTKQLGSDQQWRQEDAKEALVSEKALKMLKHSNECGIAKEGALA